MMQRRTFLKLILAAAATVCLPSFGAENEQKPKVSEGPVMHPRSYPGRVVELDEKTMCRIAMWLG